MLLKKYTDFINFFIQWVFFGVTERLNNVIKSLVSFSPPVMLPSSIS